MGRVIVDFKIHMNSYAAPSQNCCCYFESNNKTEGHNKKIFYSTQTKLLSTKATILLMAKIRMIYYKESSLSSINEPGTDSIILLRWTRDFPEHKHQV